MSNEVTVEGDEGRAQEFLTFSLGKENYALDILNVQEIRSYEQPVRIAGAPEFIMGVINLRGTMVPVVDLRVKFNTGVAEYSPFTVLIIITVANRLIGVIVDAVSDVVFLKPSQIRAAPAFSTAVDVGYIRGIAAVDERMLIVMNIEKLMRAGDMALMDDVLAAH